MGLRQIQAIGRERSQRVFGFRQVARRQWYLSLLYCQDINQQQGTVAWLAILHRMSSESTSSEINGQYYCSGNGIVMEKQIERVIELRRKGQRGPFYVVDLDEVERRVNDWKTELPSVDMFYAMKCNHDVKVLALLEKLGAGFDCATKEEIEQVLATGASPDRIIYANPDKEPSHLKYAWENGVNLTVFDNGDELYKIHKLSPKMSLLLRILPPFNDEKCLGSFRDKYGCRLSGVRSLLLTAQQLKLDVCGVCFQVGLGSSDGRYYEYAIEASRKVFNEAQKIGFQFRLLDIGGGFHGQLNPDVPFKSFTTAIKDSLTKHFPPELGVKVIGEPGQYVVRSAFTLVADVIGKRVTSSEDNINDPKTLRYMYTINESNHLSFRVYSRLFRKPSIIVVQDIESASKYPSKVWGASLEGFDVIAENEILPEMRHGDSLVFPDMGAYSLVFTTRFVGLPQAIRFYYKQGELIE